MLVGWISSKLLNKHPSKVDINNFSTIELQCYNFASSDSCFLCFLPPTITIPNWSWRGFSDGLNKNLVLDHAVAASYPNTIILPGGIFNITGWKSIGYQGIPPTPPNAMFPPKQYMAFLSGNCLSPPIIPLVSRPWPPLGTVYPSFGPRGGGTLLDVTCLARRRLETRKNRQGKIPWFFFQFHS